MVFAWGSIGNDVVGNVRWKVIDIEVGEWRNKSSFNEP